MTEPMRHQRIERRAVALDRTLTCVEACSALVTPELERTTSRYIVEGELARGGLGRIFQAHDRLLHRAVAVKELIVATPTLRARLERRR